MRRSAMRKNARTGILAACSVRQPSPDLLGFPDATPCTLAAGLGGHKSAEVATEAFRSAADFALLPRNTRTKHRDQNSHTRWSYQKDEISPWLPASCPPPRTRPFSLPLLCLPLRLPTRRGRTNPEGRAESRALACFSACVSACVSDVCWLCLPAPPWPRGPARVRMAHAGLIARSKEPPPRLRSSFSGNVREPDSEAPAAPMKPVEREPKKAPERGLKRASKTDPTGPVPGGPPGCPRAADSDIGKAAVSGIGKAAFSGIGKSAPARPGAGAGLHTLDEGS